MLARNTYLEVNLKQIQNNVSKIIKRYPNYKYYIGVVKADCYGQGPIEPVKAIINGGCNYLAVATFDEALRIREEIKDIPILCLGVIPAEYIKECIINNISVTINSMEYLQELENKECKGLKVHLKINTGMNRLGIENCEDVDRALKMIEQREMNLEGIYTHLYDAENKDVYEKQISRFKNAIQKIDLNKIKIIHVSASEGLTNYEKLDFVNACRLGIIMYGFTNYKSLELESTVKLISEVEQIHKLNEGDTVGYGGTYKAKTNGEKIAVIPIGYADGIIRKNKGRDVYINNKRYEIVGNICMDMLFVKVDDDVKLHDKVLILKDNKHIEEVAEHLDTIPYEVLCSIGKRVPRIYKWLNLN